MRVLILGGTGAMGVHVVEHLVKKGWEIYVTTRRNRESQNNIHYIVGDAKDNSFIDTLCLEKNWDAIIDFMVYDVELLKSRIDVILNATKQYVFLSSARVYADSPNDLITEDSPRLLDVCKDQDYLKTNEYALAKAREEDILFHSEKTNWTIIRPSLTYSETRLQLGVYEKENWLYRALHGRAIVFSKDLMDKYYTMSYGGDVAEGIAAVVGKREACGEVFQVVVEHSHKWSEILDIYLNVIEKKTGKRPDVIFTERCTNLDIASAKYQVLYGRYFNRHFNNSKINTIIDTSKWVDVEVGLSDCLEKFLEHPVFGNINWKIEACIDKVVHRWTPLREISGFKNKIMYILYRMGVMKK